jgi:hypothetical protein
MRIKYQEHGKGSTCQLEEEKDKKGLLTGLKAPNTGLPQT